MTKRRIGQPLHRRTQQVAGSIRRQAPAAPRPLAVRSFASDDRPGSPLSPSLRATLMAPQVSPEASGMQPDRWVGHMPVRRKWASAQARMRFSVSAGRLPRFRAPRFRASNSARDCTRGRPQRPSSRASFIDRHVLPGASGMGPDWAFGHFPVRSWCASAHERTRSRERLDRSPSKLNPCRWRKPVTPSSVHGRR